MSKTSPTAGAPALLAELDRVAGLPARLASIFAGLAGLASVAFAWVLARLVDRIVFAGEGPAALAPTFAALATVAALRAVSTFALDHAAFAAAARVRRHVFDRLLDRFAALGPVCLAERPIGELAAAATEAVDGLAPLWRAWKPAVARAAVVPLAILVAVFPTDPLAAVILLLALPLLVWLSILAGRGAEEASGRQWESLARLGGHLLDQIRGLGELKLAGTSDRAIERVAASADAYGRETMAVLRIAFLSALMLEFVTTGAIAGVAIAVGFRLLWGSLDFSTGFFVLLLAPEFFAPLREMGVRRHARIEATAALDEIAAVLGDDTSAPAPTPAPAAPRRTPPAIRFEGVRVVHADGRVALDGLDLDVAAGETVALVGPSGAGKSTVLALLCGFLVPSSGRILIDGIPLDALDLADWRHTLVHVPQTPAFFEGSIADNVAMGRPGAEGAIDRALAEAGVADLVARLPQGIETPLGEGGRSLSGGEAQRLSLARAFFADGSLLLFDEPTAHLDRATQAGVTAAIERLAAGRTAILIAHRRETLAHVDRVVRIEAGHAVESGPPAAMLGSIPAGVVSEEADAAIEPVRDPSRRACGAPQDETPEISSEKQAPHAEEASAGRRLEASRTAPLRAPPKDAEAPPPAPAMRDLLRLVRLWRGSRLWLAAALGVSLVTTAADLALMATAGWFVAAMGAAGLAGVTMNYFTPSAIIRFTAIVRTGGRWLDRVAGHEATFRLLAATRVDLFRSLERIAPGGLEDLRSAEIAARLKLDVDRLELVFLRLVAPLVVAASVGVVVTAIVAHLASGTIALAFAAAFFAGGMVLPFLTAHAARAAGRREAEAASTLRRRVHDHLEGIGTLLVTGDEDASARDLAARLEARIADEARVAGSESLARAGQGLARDATVAAVLDLGAALLAAGAANGPDLTAAVLLTLAAFETTAPVAVAAAGLATMRAALSRLFALLDRPPTVIDPADPVPLPDRFDVVCDHIGFARPGRAQPVFVGLDFALPQGGIAVVARPSGWGKSTLADLLVRVHDPASGAIRLGGVPIADLALADLRRVIAVAPQRPHVFDATVAENLRAFAPAARDEDLEAALAMAGLVETIAAMPAGLETRVGAGGARLSGGEIRRLALARVWLRPDARVLVLDEPSEGLDDVAARALAARVAEAATASGRSLLVFSHRPWTAGTAEHAPPSTY